VPDNKLRCHNPQVDPGGGGINVAKGMKRLGGDVTAFVLAGGRNGEYLKELLTTADVPFVLMDSACETRESIVISEYTSNHQYRIVVDGPVISEKTSNALLQKLISLDPFPEYVVASGSLPLGIPENYYALIARIVRERGARFILDTSGESLKLALKEGAYLVKPNLGELSKLSGTDQLALDDVDEAAQALIAQGICEVVVVSMGAAGAMLVTKDMYKIFPAPTVPRKSTVGAGDSMVAGMIWSLQQGKSLEEMTMMGVACGTAATMNEGTKLFLKEDVFRLYDWICRQKK
ncbi:MAG: 1-phosphofructokinase family hexose kinase, partial [Chitinophagaceae bacterium]